MKKLLVIFLILPLMSMNVTVGEDIFFGDSIVFGNELGPLQYSSRWTTKYSLAVNSTEFNFGLSGAAMTPGLNVGRPVFNIADVPLYLPTNKHIFVSYWLNDFYYGGTPAAFASYTATAVDGIIAKGWPAAKVVLCFNYIPPSLVNYSTSMTWLAALKTVKQSKGTSFLDFYTPINAMPDNASYGDASGHPTPEWNLRMSVLAQTNIEPPGTLPATIIAFSGVRQSPVTNLKWVVAQEQNVKTYTVEKSDNGNTWSDIGVVNSLGNTSAQRSYSFVDNGPSGTKQLYRLRQTDYNGSIKISNVVVVTVTKPSTLQLAGVFPNPAAGELSLQIIAPEKEILTITLTDAVGHLTKFQKSQVELGANTVTLDLTNVAKGNYIVAAASENHHQHTAIKFVKE